jgi:hypothetical protein
MVGDAHHLLLLVAQHAELGLARDRHGLLLR